jgi:hypothetical protein
MLTHQGIAFAQKANPNAELAERFKSLSGLESLSNNYPLINKKIAIGTSVTQQQKGGLPYH